MGSYYWYPYRRAGKMPEYSGKRIPDYTELAYKEAVSKLRYFLAGNYSPSVRSYGGGSVSIKNLDESDGDIDKKYSYPGVLAEYKPRTRLTAKYTTLYADSLKNYSPPAQLNHGLSSSQPTASADLTGGTNPDVINFIQKQEEYIEQLERESQYCRDELNCLLGKVKEVISENEHLHEVQKNKLISKMFSCNPGSETDDPDDLNDSTGLDSDNKGSQKFRKARRPVKLEGPNIVFESRISELEAQLTQAKIDLKKIQEENNENKRKLASGIVDSACLDGFKRQIDNLQRDKTTLEAQVAKLKLNLENRDVDNEARYKRGSDVIESKLREEKNNLEAELRRLKDELSSERNRIREMAGEGARRALQERSAAEQRYNAHFDQLSHDLTAQYDNVAKLQLELERQRREENDLKRELSMKNAAIDELKMELKNKSSTLQADLAHGYAEKASLEEELASARLTIERQQRQAKHETNRLNSEIQSLRQRLDRADADVIHSRRENLRLTDQIAALEKELNMKTLTPISPERKIKEKDSVLDASENKHAKTVTDLQNMVHSQNSLMEKLTSECRLLKDKLDDANRRHKAQRRGRAGAPIRTQRERSRSREQPVTSRQYPSEKESVSSNNYPPIIVGPLTTNQDLSDNGEKVFNLPLMIQQPFLRDKKEPIKVDISVKLIPKPRKKDKRKRNHEPQIQEVTIETRDDKGIHRTVSMETTDDNVNVVTKDIEYFKESSNEVVSEGNLQTETITVQEVHKTVERTCVESTESVEIIQLEGTNIVINANGTENNMTDEKHLPEQANEEIAGAKLEKFEDVESMLKSESHTSVEHEPAPDTNSTK